MFDIKSKPRLKESEGSDRDSATFQGRTPNVRPRRSGLYLISILVMLSVCLGIFTIGYRKLNATEKLVEYSEYSPSQAPDIGRALAHIMACLQAQIPVADPYSCAIRLGKGANAQYYRVNIKKLPPVPPRPTTIRVIETEPVTDPVGVGLGPCTICDMVAVGTGGG